MGKTIDERVLEMRFENDQFEQGIRQSTQSLEMLRKQLNFDGAAESLSNIEKTMNNADFSGMANNIETISRRMSTFGIIGEQVIRNITDGVMKFGQMATKAVFNLVKTGGLNRALNIEQAKFQLEGLGVAWEDVAGDIDYAVKGTRYGLDAAAKAAAQLSASGVQLGEDMKGALRGISGVAAMTNQEYEGIAQIFTTVASNGKLMTMQLRQFSTYGLNVSAALAKELGTTEQAINEMVSQGEIDFNTFAKAMDRAFGEHATKANQTFTGSLANMKAALSRLGAEFYMGALPNLRDVFNSITPVIDAVKKGLAPAFSYLNSAMTATSLRIQSILDSIDLDGLVSDIQVQVSKIKNFLVGLSYEQYDPTSNITRTIEGLKAAFSILQKVFGGLFGIVKSLVVAMEPLGNAFLNITATIGDFLVWLNQAIEETGALEAVFSAVEQVISGVVNSVGSVLEAITDTFADFAQINFKPVGDFGKSVVTDFNPVKVVIDAVRTSFQALGNGIRSLSPIFEKVGGVIESAFEKMGNAIANGGFEKVLDTLNSGVITFAIANFMDLGKAGDYLFKMLGRGIAPIKVNLTTLRNTLTAYYTSINADILLKIAKAVGILALSLVALSLVDGEKLATGLGAISILFVELVASMKILMGFMSGMGILGVLKLNVVLMSMAVAIAILSGSLISLAQLDIQQIGIGLLGLSGAMAVMLAGIAGLSKISGRLSVTAAAMIGLGIAMNLLASAVSKMGELDLTTLGKGLGGLAVLMAELALFMGRGRMTEMTMRAAAAMILFGAAMNVFASAIGRMGSFDMKSIGKGLAGIGGVMAEIALFTKIASSGGGNLVLIGIGMNAVAASMLIFANAMGRMSDLGLEGIGKGLLGIGGALTAVTIALKLLPKDTALLGVGLIAVGLALQQVGVALNMLGSMTWEQVGVGLVALGGSLTILALGMKAMTGSLAGAAALLVVSTAIAILAPQLMLLSMLSLPGLGMALLALASALGVFAGIAFLVQAAIPAMLGLGAAFTLLGGGVAGLGIGLGGVTTALATLAALGGPAVISITESLKALISLVPFLMEQVGLGIVEMATAIGNGATAIGEALVKIGNAALNAISTLAPKIIETGADLVVKLVQALVTRAPQLVQAGISLIMALLEGIRNNIYDIVTVAVDIIVEFCAALQANLPRLVDAGIQLIIGLINDMAAAIPEYAVQLTDAAWNLGSGIVQGILKGIGNIAKKLKDKIVGGVQNALSSAKSFLGIHSPSRVFRDELGKPIVAGIALGMESDVPSKAIVATVGDALIAAQKALKINSPSLVFKDEVGRWIAEGIAEGIEEDDTIEEVLKKKADNIAQAFSDYINEQSIYSDIARLNWELWQQMYADEASTADFFKEYEKFLKEDLKYKERQAKAAADELKQTIEVFGESSQQAFEATKKMLEARKTYLEAQMTLANIDNEMYAELEQQATNQRNHINEIADKQADIAQAEYDLWVSMFPDATAYEKLEKQVQYLDGSIARQKDKVHRLAEELEWARERFGDASEEVLDAQAKYLKAQKDYFDLVNDRKTSITNYIEGGGLSQDQKDALSKAEQTIKEQESNLAEYELYLRDLAETNEKYGFGWSVDEMEAIARKRSGYNKEELDEARKVQKELQEIMEKSADLLGDTIEDKFSKIVDLFSKFGIKYADSMGNAFTTTVKKNVIPAMTAVMGVATGNLGQVLGSITNMIPKPDTNIQQKPTGSTSGGSSSITNTNPGKVDGSVWKPSTKPSGSGSNRPMIVANYNVTQNNTSPKALTSSTIYRQTSTLFAGMASAANKILSNKVSSMVKA